ncbi:NAD(P)-binding domain-containing protein [Agrococcus sp. HG114]|uniref:NAD(P)-binding domain-containing protein n=1 Tax=Agrococcus sp. HG114 TaxID=2969757 RepID=UPI00215ABE00|nr:NAD(P)-binding domain-containing protein [Agrococcus sp. HG114]MCR8670044.1 NAD(P)-binding domain-containing protein [Agrococcus sp. HG114]
MADLPVVVIGAGPQGLAAGAHLLERGIEPILLERGDSAGAAVREWGHVRLFSSWPELIDSASRRLLRAAGRRLPSTGYPKGAAWREQYLEPLAAALGDRIRFGTEAERVTRMGRDLVVSEGRGAQPFVVHVRTSDGREDRILARAVIDASGTWANPGPLGGDGALAVGERAAAAAGAVSYRIPDDVSGLAGASVAVVGAGHSATHAVLRLAELARRAPGTRVIWVLRRATAAQVFGSGAADALPQRASLGTRARRAIDDGLVELVTGFRVAAARAEEEGIRLVAEDGREVGPIAHAFALTGFRPDRSLLAELRVDLDPALESVAGIAAEIDPNIHSCGTVAATGAAQLRMPEPGLFVVGAKSYGRAPTFLALTGYEQVRSVVAHLAGDEEAAARNELVIPETGVCGGAVAFDGAGSCCAPARAAEPVAALATA